tara:strand:+ start:54 stop:881 length:828 start_codon:yes stop_codon:yes gene_type:complete
MGRALKIQKNNVGSGSTVTGTPPVTTYNQTILTDAGFPNFGSLTSPATPYNSANTFNTDQFVGVVGGSPATSTPSTTFPEVLAAVNILLADGTDTTAGAGRLIRQKGAHKFLVAYTASATADESLIIGQAYQISTLGTTDWQACGAGSDAAVGDVFTAVAVGSGTGEAYPVGVCVLSNVAAPTAGNMSIEYSVGDSAAVYASYITNKWIRDWNGMTYNNYSNDNLGENIQSSENFYVTNFFTDEGTVTWSGAEIINGVEAQNGSLQLAQVVNVTS